MGPNIHPKDEPFCYPLPSHWGLSSPILMDILAPDISEKIKKMESQSDE